MKNSRFKVISIHPITTCNMACSFCYRKNASSFGQLPLDFFLKIVPFIKKHNLANQIAVGGGEILLFPDFVKEMGKTCKKNKILLNITTNGSQILHYSDKMVKETLKDVKLISVSYDSEKLRQLDKDFGATAFMSIIAKIRKNTNCLIGVNLLMEQYYNNDILIDNVRFLFNYVDYIYLLYPKDIKGPDILNPKLKLGLIVLTKMFPNLYVDDLTKSIIENNNYNNWSRSCHYCKDIISIDQSGHITGCSFDKNPLMTLKEPKDIIRTKDVVVKERFKCPYLVRK